MPEIVGYNPQLEMVGTALRSADEFPAGVNMRVQALKARGEIVNHGIESAIFPKDEKTLFGLDYAVEMSAQEAKATYYAHKAFSILHPFNFPRIHMAAGVEDSKPHYINDAAGHDTGTVRAVVVPYAEDEARSKPKHSFSAVEKFCKDVGVKPSTLFDFKSDKNFMQSSVDDGVYYVDKIKIQTLQESLSTVAVEDWMRTHTVADKATGERRKYSEHEIRQVGQLLDRAKSFNIPYVAAHELGTPIK